MDITKFFAKVVSRRKPNLIRELTEAYMLNPKAIFFAGGMPNTDTFPYKEITVKYKDGNEMKLTDEELVLSLQYGPSQGYIPLLELWKKFQQTWHSPSYNNWDVAFTTGSQDACNKIIEMFVDEGQPVMVQIPTYTGTISTLTSQAPDLIGIEQDEDGIIPEKILKVCEERSKANKPLPKFLYVNPTGANPTGSLLTTKRKIEIYKLAKKYDFLILEDDAYYFINFIDKQPISFFSLDTDGRVIRFDSFSKIISSGIRLGAVSAQKSVIQNLCLHIQQTNLHTSSLSQMLLYKLLGFWSHERFQQHINQIQQFYREKRDIMLIAMEKHLSGLAEWSPPKGGMFVWVKITALNDIYDLVMTDCIAKHILILPGVAFNYDSKKTSQHIRLCYSYATSEEVDKGLHTLATLIREKAAKKNQVM